MTELIVDAERGRPGSKYRTFTGIYVRAKYDGAWDSFDIATLTKESLVAWAKERDPAYILALVLEHDDE